MRRSVLLLLSVVAACGETVTEPQPVPPRAAALRALSDSAFEANVGAVVTLRVQVSSDTGSPLGDVNVNWLVLSGSGALAGGRTASGADGIAEVAWTLGEAPGEQVAAAFVGDVAPVSFRAVAHPGPVATLMIEADSLRFDALEQTATLALQAADTYGNAVSPVDANWESRDGAIVSVDTVGTVRARANGAAWVVAVAGSAVDSVLVHVDQLARSFVLGADTLIGVPGDTLQFAVRALDANGAPVPDAVITVRSQNEAVATLLSDSTLLVTGWGLGTLSLEADSARAAITVLGDLHWVELPQQTAEEGRQAWIASPEEAWAGLGTMLIGYGPGGAVTRYENPCSPFSDMAIVGPGDAIALSNVGCLFRYDAGTWTQLYPSIGQSANQLVAVLPDSMFASTPYGIRRFDGVTWHHEVLPADVRATPYVWALHRFEDGVILAGGADGLLLRFDGETWSRVDFGGFATIWKIEGVRSDSAFIVTDAGPGLWNGQTWTSLGIDGVNIWAQPLAPTEHGFLIARGHRGVHLMQGLDFVALPGSPRNATSIAYAPGYGVLVATTGGRVFRGTAQ